MKMVSLQSLLPLGLLLIMATACSDPSQFNELMTGEAVYPTDQTATVSDKTPSDESKVHTEAYVGEEAPAEETADPAATANADTVAVPSDDSSTNQNSNQNITPPVASNKIFDDCDASPDKNIVAELYQLDDGTKKLPDFSQMAALRTVCLSQLNIKDRQFTEGFPGVEELVEWFGLDMRFQVNVPKSGNYEFTLISDDGAILWIDDQKVVDNDGLHAVTEKKAKTYLEAGVHDFHVNYYQGPRWRIALELFWKLPGSSSRSYIPLTSVSRPGS